MQRTKIILASLLAISLAGCVLRGKSSANAAPAAPKPVVTPAGTAPAPPPVLSIPQTRAQLPAPQPGPQDAVVLSIPQEEDPPPAAPVPPPKSPPKSRPAGSGVPVRAETPVASQGPNPEPERAKVQEIIPAEEVNRLREEANTARGAIRQRLGQMPARVLRQQKDRIDRIQSFMKQSEDAERRGDLRQASELAAKALVLVR